MHFFGGFKRINLFFALEDQELVDEILTKYPTRYVATSHPNRVRCVETGQVFSSCGAAARELHVTQACISLAIRQARPVAALGMTFEALRGAGPSLRIEGS